MMRHRVRIHADSLDSPFDRRPSATRPRSPCARLGGGPWRNMLSSSAFWCRAYTLVVVFALLRSVTGPRQVAVVQDVSNPDVQDEPSPPSRLLQREFEQGSTSEPIEFKNCPATFPSPAPGRHQRCCKFFPHRPDKISCLPNLVILGAQKSGTTAVHGYLLLHESILPSKKKEMHIFDSPKRKNALSHKLAGLLPIVSEADTARYITVDNSPSYIADINACKRMNEALSPDARYILLLREPVSRVWSDVQMKWRRIKYQTEFLDDIFPNNVNNFRECIHAKPLSNFKACLPSHVASHGRIPAFFTFLSKLDEEDLESFQQSCTGSPANATACVQGPYNGKILREKMPDVELSIRDEMERLDVKLSKCYYRKRKRAQKAEAKDSGEEGDIESLLGSIATQCLPHGEMMSDITKNYVWRSLYHPQLEVCTEALGREKVLVVDFSEFKKNPDVVLRAIFNHAGLTTPEHLSAEDATKTFNAVYPDFANISGWAKVSTSSDEEEMPESLRHELTEFFRPYNRRLFDFLGVPPFDGWEI